IGLPDGMSTALCCARRKALWLHQGQAPRVDSPREWCLAGRERSQFRDPVRSSLIPQVIPASDGAPWSHHAAVWSPAAVSAMPVSAGFAGVIWAARTPSEPARPADRWLRAG